MSGAVDLETIFGTHPTIHMADDLNQEPRLSWIVAIQADSFAILDTKAMIYALDTLNS